jgi:hypothetical protein
MTENEQSAEHGSVLPMFALCFFVLYLSSLFIHKDRLFALIKGQIALFISQSYVVVTDTFNNAMLYAKARLPGIHTRLKQRCCEEMDVGR